MREIGGTGRKRFGHRAIALINRHRKVDALGLEVAGGRSDVIGAYDDALLRGGRIGKAGDDEKRGDRAKIHRRTLAKQA